MDGVVVPRELPVHPDEPEADADEALALEAGEYLKGEPPADGVGLYQDQGAFHGEGS